MQPELALQYNSEGGNGWLGLGWSLNISSITLDTRWGAPRFDPDKETETYLLDGEMLDQPGHRNWPDRTTSDRVFHRRIEGSFERIVRKGNSPQSYYWIITDKQGKRRFYGGNENGVISSAVLRDGSDNIVRWHLTKVIDTNNNNILYTYETATDPGVPNGNIGRQIYPKTITYTGAAESAGKYSVEFERADTVRTDVQVNCRSGLKEVTAHFLKRIRIKFDGQPVRSYVFAYEQGAFFKSLLASVTELDRQGQLFYGHSFSYHDDVRQGGQYVPYEDQDWDDHTSDGLAFDSQNPFVGSADEQASLLGASLSSNWSFGGSANIGPVGNPFLQTLTVGYGFGYSRSTSRGFVSLIDVNGDNLPDKLFSDGNGLHYRPNLSASGTMGFGTPLTLSGTPTSNFNLSKTRSTNRGPEGHAGPVFVGKNKSRSKTSTPIYLLDRNGDGLIDLNYNGLVYFNFRNSLGLHTFSADPDQTENSILAGESMAFQSIDANEITALLAESPLIDVVRVWVAPYDGTVSVNATVQLREPLDATYDRWDGADARIQFKESFECSVALDTGNYFEQTFGCPWLSSLQVNMGDRLYFRLHSRMDGTEDRVIWDPVITYTTVTSPDIVPPSGTEAALRLDANDKNIYRYQASTDFLPANEQGIKFKMPVQWSFKAP
ncbi:MAG: hypothetical protein IPI72_12270 [Flavobacteriales bacterium]|nr:hypothetical protein [Flavobacteriales bacterium]